MQKNANASLVLGIISLVLALVLGTVAPFVPLVLGLIGLILAVTANRGGRTGSATAGLVLSIIAVVISGLFMLLWLFCLGAVSTAVDGATASWRWW